MTEARQQMTFWALTRRSAEDALRLYFDPLFKSYTCFCRAYSFLLSPLFSLVRKERKRAKLERKRLELVRAELERKRLELVWAELERKRLELERLELERAELERAELERMRAEVERMRAELSGPSRITEAEANEDTAGAQG
jgi:hypothetical protein